MTNDEARRLPLGSTVLYRGRPHQVMLKHLYAQGSAFQVSFTLVDAEGHRAQDIFPRDIALPPEPPAGWL